MAGAFGLRVRPRIAEGGDLRAAVDFDPYRAESASQLIDAWLPITVALNSLNRCMGQPDLYPFVLAPAVMQKLGYIHELVHEKGGSAEMRPVRNGQYGQVTARTFVEAPVKVLSRSVSFSRHIICPLNLLVLRMG
jgi:hypothetical protein